MTYISKYCQISKIKALKHKNLKYIFIIQEIR
jgi:hypothetical protein